MVVRVDDGGSEEVVWGGSEEFTEDTGGVIVKFELDVKL
jgi:hypothetical protein